MALEETNREKNIFSRKPGLTVLVALAVIILSGLFLRWYMGNENPSGPEAEATGWKAQAAEKWGMPYDQLPEKHLGIISPHSRDIQMQFQQAFQSWAAQEAGIRVKIWWYNIGGGSHSILNYLMKAENDENAPSIDVVFGGGEYVFEQLAKNGLLDSMVIDAETVVQIPGDNHGLELYDSQMRWCGTALSGFGILYNQQMLEEAGCGSPSAWQDLAYDDYFDKIVLANPANSGTAAAINNLIVQSSGNWPDGWKRLMLILSNVQAFIDRSTDAANQPLLHEVPITACIDFFGISRQEMSPEDITFALPQDGEGMSVDPIGILHTCKNPDTARFFVNFVLSMQGQSLWGLPSGHPDGPSITTLYRKPIRKDFYSRYSGALPGWLADPYENANQEISSVEFPEAMHSVLISLVQAAAVENHELMKQARARLIAEGMPAEKVARFAALPEDVDTLEKVEITGRALSDSDQAGKLIDYWKKHFETVYREILE